MATTKAARLKKDKVEVITISADQFLAGVNRFNNVCEFVERQMDRQPRELAGVSNEQRQAAAPIPPKPAPVAGVEQMAYDLRGLAADVQKQAETIRLHLTNGGSPNQLQEGAQCSAPTMGPIKDALDLAASYLFSVRKDLDMIAQYTIGN